MSLALFHTRLSVIARWAIIVVLISLIGQSSQAAPIVVLADGNIQAAINTGQCGDTIVLQAGGVYVTPADFTAINLPNKGACSGFKTPPSLAQRSDGTRIFSLAVEGVEELAVLIIRLLLDLALIAVVLDFVRAGTWLKERFSRTYLDLKPKSARSLQDRNAGRGPKHSTRGKRKAKPKKVSRKRSPCRTI